MFSICLFVIMLECMTGYDSCVDNDAAVTSLWQVAVAQGAASTAATSCSASFTAFGCLDIAYAGLCPVTCGLCVNHVNVGSLSMMTLITFSFLVN